MHRKFGVFCDSGASNNSCDLSSIEINLSLASPSSILIHSIPCLSMAPSAQSSSCWFKVPSAGTAMPICCIWGFSLTCKYTNSLSLIRSTTSLTLPPSLSKENTSPYLFYLYIGKPVIFPDCPYHIQQSLFFHPKQVLISLSLSCYQYIRVSFPTGVKPSCKTLI